MKLSLSIPQRNSMDNIRKIVLLDIDYTVFNTDLYIHALRTNFSATLNLPLQKTEDLVKQAIINTRKRKNHFDPHAFLQEMTQLSKRPDIADTLSEIFWNKETYARAVYEEVEEVINTLLGNEIEVGILSTGNEEHQRQKVATLASLLSQEHIHIFIDKIKELEHIITKYKDYRIFILDDLPEVLEAAKRVNPSVIAIQVNKQKKYDITDKHDTIKPDFSVKNLREIVPIIIKS